MSNESSIETQIVEGAYLANRLNTEMVAFNSLLARATAFADKPEVQAILLNNLKNHLKAMDKLVDEALSATAVLAQMQGKVQDSGGSTVEMKRTRRKPTSGVKSNFDLPPGIK